MEKLAVIEKVELYPLGEIAMGCPSYGLIINTNFGQVDVFREIPIVIGSENYRQQIDQSTCSRYLSISSDFGIYILDIKDQSISIFKITIRSNDGAWSEEQAIYGSNEEHIKGFSHNKQYFLQFPFVRKNKFLEILNDYKTMRQKQIAVAKNAI